MRLRLASLILVSAPITFNTFICSTSTSYNCYTLQGGTVEPPKVLLFPKCYQSSFHE